MPDIRGVVPIVPTIFDQQGRFAQDQFQSVIDHLCKTGVSAATIFGVGSEFYKLDDEDRKQILQTFVKHTNGRMATVASITHHSTEIAVKDALWAQENGIDALMLLPPFFMSPSSQAIFNHIKEVIDGVDIPVVIQYAPANTGVGISTDVFIDLFERAKNDVYVKAECRPIGGLVTELVKSSQNKLGVLIGDGGIQLYEGLERGATGVMPGSAWPEIYVKIIEQYQSGNKGEALDIFNKLLPYVNCIGQSAEMFNRFEKICLVRRGIIQSDYCRKPFYEPDEVANKLFNTCYHQMEELLDYCS